MSWAIDTPLLVGDVIFTAIAEIKVSAHTSGSTLGGVAEKRPLLFLLVREDDATAVDINGHRYEADEIELLYPGAIDQARQSTPRVP